MPDFVGSRYLARASLFAPLFFGVTGSIQQLRAAQPDITTSTTNIEVSLSLESPAVVGRPLWVKISPLHKTVHEIHYPYKVCPRDFGLFSFQVNRDDKPVDPISPKEMLPYDPSGPWGGWVAPPSAKTGRLPLHAAYRLTSPGHYAIRLQKALLTPPHRSAVSDWLEFDLVVSTKGDSELELLLKSTTTDPGQLVGDILPSLLAYSGVPVTRKIASYLHHTDRLVREFSLQSLAYFGEDVLRQEVLLALQSNGPTEEMGYLFSWKRKLFSESHRDIAQAAIRTLKQNPAAALTTLRFLRFGPDPTTEKSLQSIMDSNVHAASDEIISSGPQDAQHALALYAGGSSEPEWNDILRRLASQGKAREQALIALAWHGNEGNLAFLGEKLLSGDDAANSLPYQLIKHFGKRGEELVAKAIRQSKSMPVRWGCARELAILGYPDAFQFYLDNLDWNQGRRGEILQFMRDNIPGGRNLTDDQLPTFLRKQIANPRGR